MGGSVNQGAQQAEQQNQILAQQYAAQQQLAAQDSINAYLAQNKPPGQTAAPVQGPPQMNSPATIGGGNIQAGQVPGQGRPGQPQQPPQAQQPQQPRQPQAPGAGAMNSPSALANMNPQQKAAIMAAIQAQAGAMPQKAM